ncbi:hypothetical protein E2C01_089954 [Portunus trituberculatus]|uniref:Uncharacterized protein n=1 Tax=Portunus trituberculatus TaxID=210409 RepID=A0A5B7JDE8_PORTR|nr:hypothetical protein [Portunus trituberculatus]
MKAASNNGHRKQIVSAWPQLLIAGGQAQRLQRGLDQPHKHSLIDTHQRRPAFTPPLTLLTLLHSF